MPLSGWQNKNICLELRVIPQLKNNPTNSRHLGCQCHKLVKRCLPNVSQNKKIPKPFSCFPPCLQHTICKDTQHDQYNKQVVMQRTTNKPLGLTLKTPEQKHHQQFTIVSTVPPPTAQTWAASRWAAKQVDAWDSG